MELKQLRYFVAVAEELHFSRASIRLNLAQSALSSHIRRLEDEVGGALFVRTSRRVFLTPAGETLLADARGLLMVADQTLDRVRAITAGDEGQLVIGSLGPASGGLLGPAISRFAARRPKVRVEVRTLGFSEVISSITEDQVDVAFVYEPVSHPEIEITRLLNEERVVVLSSRHRLARRPQLRPADLVGERFVTHPTSVPEPWRDFWLLTAELRRRPTVSSYVADRLEEWLDLIERGEGIDTCPALIASYYSWPGVAFVPLIDAPPARLALARRAGDQSPVTDEFRRLVVDLSRNAPFSRASADAEGNQSHQVIGGAPLRIAD